MPEVLLVSQEPIQLQSMRVYKTTPIKHQNTTSTLPIYKMVMVGFSTGYWIKNTIEVMTLDKKYQVLMADRIYFCGAKDVPAMNA